MKSFIRNKIGIVMSDDPEEEITSLDETFPEFNQDKYVGVNILNGFYGGQDVLQIAHHDKFYPVFASWSAILETKYIENNDGADWYRVYEDLIVHIVESLFPDNEVCWCMDLARKVEQELGILAKDKKKDATSEGES